MPVLSLIVPVYKAERYLEKCVDSILHQNFQDWELLLIDDGSPDESPAICDRYAGKDSRVRVIHQKNAGVSAARNKGLELAQGEWIGFVDADDWIQPDMYEVLLTESRDADVVMCDALSVYENGKREPYTICQLPESCLLGHKDFFPSLLLEFAGEVWRCIYRRSLIEKYGIRFPRGLKFSEDRVFNLRALGYSGKVRYQKKPLYMRYDNQESCIHVYHPDHALHGRRAAEETEKAIAEAWENDPLLQRAYLVQYADVFFRAFSILRSSQCGLNQQQRMSEIRKICANPDLRSMIGQYGFGGRQGRMVLKNQYFRLYHYGGWITKIYEKWLNIWYSTWLYQKIQNVKELFTSQGLEGILKKLGEKFRR